MQNDLNNSFKEIEKKFAKAIATNIHISSNLLNQIPNFIKSKNIIIISDSQIVSNNQQYFKHLKDSLKAKSYILSNPKCDLNTVNDIKNFIINVDYIN